MKRINALLTENHIQDSAIVALWRIWALIGGVVVAILAMTLVSPLRIPGNLCAYIAIVFLGMQLVSWSVVILRMKDAGPVFIILQSIVQFLTGATLLIMLLYQGEALALPLTDELWLSMEMAAGFDWQRFMQWLDAHAFVAHLLAAAYFTMMPQLLFLFLGLGIRCLSGDMVALPRFVMAFLIGLLVTLILASLWPSVGYYIYYHLTPQVDGLRYAVALAHADHLLGLRDGSISVLPVPMVGLVSFPSFHTLMGVLFIWAAWPYRRLRMAVLCLNLLMIIGCVPEGGHYLMDVLAGIVLAFVSIWLTRRLIPVQASV